MPAFLTATPGVKLLGVDISKQLGGLAKSVGVDLKSPAAYRAEARAVVDETARRARAGDFAQFTKLYNQSGMRNPGVFGVAGAIGLGTQVDRDYAWKKYKEIAGSEAAPETFNGHVPGAKSGLDQLTDVGNSLTDQLPAPVQKAVDDTAKALGTTSSTVTWIAIGLGVLLVVRSLRS